MRRGSMLCPIICVGYFVDQPQLNQPDGSWQVFFQLDPLRAAGYKETAFR